MKHPFRKKASRTSMSMDFDSQPSHKLGLKSTKNTPKRFHFGDDKEFELYNPRKNTFTACLSNREDDDLTHGDELDVAPPQFADCVKESIRQGGKEDSSVSRSSFVTSKKEESEAPISFQNSP